MKWINVFEEGRQQSFLRIDEFEVKKLAKILEKPYKESLKKLAKYRDIHESGEATERQQTIMMETEEAVKFMDNIINNN